MTSARTGSRLAAAVAVQERAEAVAAVETAFHTDPLFPVVRDRGRPLRLSDGPWPTAAGRCSTG